MSKRKTRPHPRKPVKARPRKPARARPRKAQHASTTGAFASVDQLTRCDGEHAAPACMDPFCYHGNGTPDTRAFPDATVFPHTFVSVTLHACGKAAGIAVCGSRQEGIPAGDPRAWGSLLERAEPMRAALAELEQLAVALECPSWCRVEICGGCRANLTKMIEADDRRLQVGRGRATQGEAQRPTP